MTQEQLNKILELHKKWLNEEPGGSQANLSKLDLSYLDLSRADLSYAIMNRTDLSGANMSKIVLHGANLRGAVLKGTNLAGADLSEANLMEAHMVGANLTNGFLRGVNLSAAYLGGANLCDSYLFEAKLEGANLNGANLFEACLMGANLYGAILKYTIMSNVIIDEDTKFDRVNVEKYIPQICPSEGAFIGWKKARYNYIIKLKITEDSKRSSAFDRKCRCSKAVVLSIENIDGTPSRYESIPSAHDPNFVYEIGKTVEVPNFCEDRLQECAPGIHFFITRQEAVDY